MLSTCFRVNAESDHKYRPEHVTDAIVVLVFGAYIWRSFLSGAVVWPFCFVLVFARARSF